jgi:hypothetical protein
VQTNDRAALLDTDDEGEHAPLLLSTLDLSHWTSIMYVSTLEGGVEKALTRLREAHAVLAHLLERDELDWTKPIRTRTWLNVRYARRTRTRTGRTGPLRRVQGSQQVACILFLGA